jgi:hypothetical protein
MEKILHPDFTQNVYNKLCNRQSLNVYSDKRKELKRLVEDLKILRPNEIRIIPLSMREHAPNFTAFLHALCGLLNTPVATALDFATAVNHFLDHSESNIWLILEDFDYLTEQQPAQKAVDKLGYNSDFLNHLNSLRNHAQVALLITSAKQLNTRDLYIAGEVIKGSRLELSYYFELPNLTFLAMKNELMQLNGNLSVCNQFFLSREWAWLATEMTKLPEAYSFLQFIAFKIQPESIISLDGFKKQVKKWKESFAQTILPNVATAQKLNKSLKPAAVTQKNLVNKSTITTEGEVHIGDKITHNHFSK